MPQLYIVYNTNVHKRLGANFNRYNLAIFQNIFITKISQIFCLGQLGGSSFCEHLAAIRGKNSYVAMGSIMGV